MSCIPQGSVQFKADKMPHAVLVRSYQQSDVGNITLAFILYSQSSQSFKCKRRASGPGQSWIFVNKLAGTDCGTLSDKVRVQQETIPLASCTKDVSAHLKTVAVKDITSEQELILSRVGIFNFDDELLATMTICPKHRHQLGGGWFKKSTCRFPGHNGNAKPTRTVDKSQSRMIHETFGTLVPVGSGKNQCTTVKMCDGLIDCKCRCEALQRARGACYESTQFLQR